MVKTTKPIKKAISKAINSSKERKGAVRTEKIDYPKNQAEYQERIVKAGKELWKNPASLPVNFPNLVIIEDKKQPLPKRAKNGDLIFADHPEFFPNTSPEEVLRAGAFGGTYFRPIISAVTNITYNSSEVLKTTVHPSWISGLPQNMLSSSINPKTPKPQNPFDLKIWLEFFSFFLFFKKIVNLSLCQKSLKTKALAL